MQESSRTELPFATVFVELFTQAVKRWISPAKAASDRKQELSRMIESIPFTTRAAFAGLLQPPPVSAPARTSQRTARP
jgi:hypothetical protein